ncbi:MAG TPA: glycogen synthase GlgA [Kiritimatiellia bacterium]|mgnify:CR=1 FL=1|nr:glycogen synthase GlgA [Kiritimatiellia bacterium]
MKIVFAASEMVPFASTGGLADVAAALPKAMMKRDAQVWRVMPLYRHVAEGPFLLKDTGLRLDIPVGFRMYKAEVWMTDDPPPATYFIRRDEFFDRSQLYSLPDRDYDDNFERFVFFQKAVVALIDALGWRPDVVHCSDWQTGLIPLFLRHGVHGMGRERREKVVFTIHNLAYQGIFPGSQYSLTNLPFPAFNVDCLEFYGNINCIKGGITGADVVTTVSKTYAQEIQTEEFGCGLQGVLTRMGDRLTGIVHGADYASWDPASDVFLVQGYNADDPAGKKACKEELIRMMNLKIGVETPLLGMVSRLVDQKGLDILADAMPALMKLDIGFVLLGAGQDKYHALCRQWAEQWPGKFAVSIGYDNPLAHKIEAGSDIYLMPSRFEPCGLNQLYSLRYGTLPVVHSTGGLEDTIEDIAADGTTGTGFKFKTYTSDALVGAVKRSLDMFGNKQAWDLVVRRAMKEDFSWERAADEYLLLYRRLLA